MRFSLFPGFTLKSERERPDFLSKRFSIMAGTVLQR
jgi:hypothetical protein